jgi:hypothetical protein
MSPDDLLQKVIIDLSFGLLTIFRSAKCLEKFFCNCCQNIIEVTPTIQENLLPDYTMGFNSSKDFVNESHFPKKEV